MHLSNNIDLQSGLVGGLIMGATSTALMYTHGKVAGISGILEGMLIFKPDDDKRWCWSYVAGLVSAGAVLIRHHDAAFATSTPLTDGTVILAGVITGMGARMGYGCTSGHGICGLPRLSLRSLTAVMTFMSSGALTAYIVRETPFRELFMVPSGALRPDTFLPSEPQAFLVPTLAATAASVMVFSYNGWLSRLMGRVPKKTGDKPHPHAPGIIDHLVTYSLGLLSGLGLGLSGMCNPDRVVDFLNFSGKERGWDPSLMAVMGGGVLFNILTFQWLSRQQSSPLLKSASAQLSSIMKMGGHKDNLKIDWRLVVGSLLFGVGWGMGGICPGPALVSLGAGSGNASLFVPALMCGIALNEVTFGNGFNLGPSTDAADASKSK